MPAPDGHRRSPSLSSSGAVDSDASAGPGRACGGRETSMSVTLDANFASVNVTALFAMELHRRKISKLFSDPDLFT